MSWIRSSAHLERRSEGDMGKRVVGAVPPSFRLNVGQVKVCSLLTILGIILNIVIIVNVITVLIVIDIAIFCIILPLLFEDWL